MDFDGTNDYVTRAYDSDFDFGTGSFTVEGWFKTGGTSSSSGSVSIRVSSSADDAEENASGATANLTSSDLELDYDTFAQEAGMRFQNVTIPQGATITSAYVQFTADVSSGGGTGNPSLTIKGEAADNAAAFSGTLNNITERTNTSASVSWSPASWTDGVANAASKTPDIKTIIQEIVDRGSWSSGNALAIMVTGTGSSSDYRRAESYDGNSAAAPELIVNYSYSPAQYLLSRYDSDQGLKVWIHGNGTLSFGVDDDASWSPNFKATSNSTYIDNIWHYFSAVKNANTTIRLYVDGSQVASNANVTTSGSVSVSVYQGDDDAEEHLINGAMDLGSSDLEMILEANDQQVGIRFQNVTIPQGATITSAYVQFTTDETSSVETSLTIYGEDADNSSIFTSTAYNITGRTKTGTSVTWGSIPAWNTVGEAGANQKTPDISAVIQEITDRAGWSNGNSLSIIISGSGKRVAESANKGGGTPAQLEINYTVSLATLTSNSAPLSIGSDEPTNGSYFKGNLDEIRVWNTARTQSQIQANMFKQIDGGTSGLVGCWRFNESSGTSAADQTSNSNTGTLTNMTDADWVASTAPIAGATTSGKTNLTAVWPSDNSNASSIMTLTDSDIAGTNCLIFGHDNGALTANTSDVPGTINRRLNRVWRLEEYGTLTGTIAFDCTDLGIGTGADLRLLVDSDGTFSDATIVTGSYSAPNFTVTSHAFVDGSYYTIASTTADNSLPVEMISFTARQERGTAVLEWITESEIDNLGFVLERRRTGAGDWTEIASYLTNPELQGQGSTTSRTEYAFIDQTVEPNASYEYRIADVSYDGNVEFHLMASLSMTGENDIPERFAIQSVYPNPFNPATTIIINLIESGSASLAVYDLLGKKVAILMEGLQPAGEFQITWKAGDLSAGIYFCQLTQANQRQTRKLILLK